MKHKWHKEIKAWADGAEIEFNLSSSNEDWILTKKPNWLADCEYRIKPQTAAKCIVKDCMNHTNEGPFVGDLCGPCWDYLTNGNGVHSQAYRNAHPKEPQYLYAYKVNGEIKFCEAGGIIEVPSGKQSVIKIGKIKLEDE
jgi:hypothetical protein